MNDDISQVLCLILDRGYTMINKKTKNIEQMCMKTFFNICNKVHIKSLYCLVTFNEKNTKICGLTSNTCLLSRKYESIKNKYETTMFENPGMIQSRKAKYRKCFDSITSVANSLILKKKQYPDALFRILVITDGIIDQSDAITVSKIANLLILNSIYLDFAIINGWVSPIVNKITKWSGGSTFLISDQIDIANIFGNIAFYDHRIRKYNKPKMYKITHDLVIKNDLNNKINIVKSINSMYTSQIIKNEENDKKFVDTIMKIKKMEESIINISNDIIKKINNAPNSTIIFLVGNTGNGKSTFMHCMQGKRMDCLKMDNRYVLNIENMPLDENNPLGHNGKSKTRTVDFMYVPELNIIFVDCPGYFDSAGPDQNLINSIAINQVFNGNKSLKMKILAFVSNDDFSQRLGAVIDALNMVYGLIPNLEILKKGLGIVITKGRKIDEKKNLKKIEAITKSDSKTIDSTWEMTEYIKHAYENKHIWSFPAPDDDFQSGKYNNFQDSKNIIEFMIENPVIDPPHSIPLDIHSFEMVVDLIQIIGNCRYLLSNLFEKMSQEYLLNKMNVSALKCWRCQIKKISKMKFNNLGEFASQIESILPFTENYSDIFKSMNLLAIFQTFTNNTEDQNDDKKSISNSLNCYKKDFFCEEDIIIKVRESLEILNNYINDSEKEEKKIISIREDFEKRNAEYIKAKLAFYERIQIAKSNQISLDVTIEEEERKLKQKKADLELYKKKIKHNYNIKCKKIIIQYQKAHSDWVSNAETKIDNLQRKLNVEKYKNKYLNSLK